MAQCGPELPPGFVRARRDSNEDERDLEGHIPTSSSASVKIRTSESKIEFFSSFFLSVFRNCILYIS